MAHTTHRARRARPILAVPAAVVSVGLAAAALTATPGAASAAGPPAPRAEITAEAPVYAVTGQGMSQDEAQALAERLGIAPALEKSGAFSYVDAARYGKVPSRKGVTGTDERGRRTVARRLDVDALKALDVMPEGEATERARGILRLPKGFDAEPQVSHTQLTMADAGGATLGQFDLDTTVAFDFTLDGHRVVGTGNRNRIAFAADGSVLALTQSVRDVQQKGFVGIVGPDAAREQCDRLYGGQVDQLEPELVYSSPALTAARAPELVLPHYACRPAAMVKQDRSALGRLVPAAPELTPEAGLSAQTDGTGVKAQLNVEGGQAPYLVQWSSSSTKLTARGDEIAYTLKGRGGLAPSEVLTATVTDANGVVTSVSAALDTAGDAVDVAGYGGDGGVFNVGIEQTVDEWQCAQDSAVGFKQEMAAMGESTKFDWRGTNAWEKDFKRTSNSGIDDQYVDTVDAQWYTGHGNSGGFSFKNKSQSDEWIVPNDSRWGDNVNLEWMMLESCQVLRDTNGTNDYFQRWAPAFDGLHVLNGFHTNAQCVGGGTGRRFASYLHPTWWGRPALTIPQAWQAMANDLEPTGTVWRSVSPARAGWVNNLGDKYWGQGTVGPDIPLSQQIGWVAVSGTV